MQDTDDDKRPTPLHRTASAGLLALTVLLPGAAVADERNVSASRRTHALLVSGGKSPSNNMLSHLHHLQDMVESLSLRGIPLERISIFSSDGENPEADLAVRGGLDARLWMLPDTLAGRYLRRPVLTNTVWDAVSLRPATLAGLRQWFEEAGRKLDTGDTLLVFVTDHGTDNKEDPANGFIELWKESLSVLEFRALLGSLKPGVRVINLMSQCFSGGFAQAMAPLGDPTPGGNVCGFYSTTADRKAYGCYPEGRDRDRIGHAFAFIEALRRNPTLEAAHLEVLVSDTTPDVPLRTSDLYLERLLDVEAERRGVGPEALVDELLLEAWRDRGRWEPQIRLLDRLGVVYGTFSPRSLEEFGTQIVNLEALSTELETYSERWLGTLNDVRQNNLAQFLDARPEWKKRTNSNVLKNLDAAARTTLLEELLPVLETFTRGRTEVWSRLQDLRTKYQDSHDAEYRVEIRLAALLRMRTLLLRVAALQFLENGASSAGADLEGQRLAFNALAECEASPVGVLERMEEQMLEDVEPLAPFEEDLAVVERARPSWLGVRFRSAPGILRKELGLERGAVQVQQVYEDSAALAAGIRPGDIVVGTPGWAFDEPRRIREWIMTSPRDTPLQLELLRDGETLQVTTVLGPYPVEMPSLPGPPGDGDQAPELPAVRLVAAPANGELSVPEGRHLLFFWATWCAPCKRSVPELLAWSEATDVPIVALSDEDAATVRGFLDAWEGHFPKIVASDEYRRSYLSYGISGTPTFVLVDEDGKIEWRQTGYSPGKGLRIDGWDWKQ